MAIIKVIEVLSQSEKSWEDAAQQAIKEASKTLHSIKSLYVKDMQLVMQDSKPQYRIDGKIAFEVDSK